MNKLTKAINRQIDAQKQKSMKKFFTSQLTFLKDFHIQAKNNTDTLSEANSLDEIILSGLNDLFYIVKEEGFGLKEYEEVNKAYVQSLELCKENFLEEFIPYVGLDTTKYKNVSDAQKAKIEEFRKSIKRRYKIDAYLTKLEWCFIEINMAVALIQINQDKKAYKKLEKLEKKVRKLCKKILSDAKADDKAIKQLTLLKK